MFAPNRLQPPESVKQHVFDGKKPGFGPRITRNPGLGGFQAGSGRGCRCQCGTSEQQPETNI